MDESSVRRSSVREDPSITDMSIPIKSIIKHVASTALPAAQRRASKLGSKHVNRGKHFLKFSIHFTNHEIVTIIEIIKHTHVAASKRRSLAALVVQTIRLA